MKTNRNSKDGLRSILLRYAQLLLILLVTTISFLMFYFGPKIAPAYGDIFVQVSTSLFSSLAFALFYSWIVEKHSIDIVKDETQKSIEGIIDAIKQSHESSLREATDYSISKISEIEQSYYHNIASHFRELVPSDYFPPTNQPDKRYNTLLKTKIATSRQYLWRGVTGRHIPLRIENTLHRIANCKVLLIDPRRHDLLWIYARGRFNNTDVSKEFIDEQVELVKRETYMSIVELFSLAKINTITVKMYYGPVFYRTVILDDLLSVSYFIADSPTPYPVTYIYSKGTFHYDAFLTDFMQTYEIPSPTISLNAQTTKDDLLLFLRDIGFEGNEVETLKEEANKFKQDFLKKI